MANKYIHYCWFGTKKLPKLAKKCIKSWKKYLPDYEIIKWNEENVNLEECPFIKEAYENKSWAFVADYARTKALKEMGGIYFDTDMEVTKDISHLLKNESFLGIEDTGYVAVGVWYEKEKNAFLPTQLLNKYQSMDGFDAENKAKLSIPILISDILKNYNLICGSTEIQVLNKKIYIYPRDYFYPYSYDHQNNLFTDNTCMIHYYDASWIPLKSRIEVNLVRRLGRKRTFNILKNYRICKGFTKKSIRIVLFPLVLYRKNKAKNKTINNEYLERLKKTKEKIKSFNNENYIVIYNQDWLGVSSATKELFENLVDCGEIYRKKDVKELGDLILNSKIKQVIFSSFALGWKDLITYIKNKNSKIKIKTFWHGSHSQILDTYGWQRNLEIINLHKNKFIDVMGTCKESLVDFYKKNNFETHFLTNKVNIDMENLNNEKSKNLKIGLYAAKCDDWRKNMFSQMAAVSMIEGATLDMVPLNETAKHFAEILGLKIEGIEKSISREELLKRMANNSLNLYVTYSECSPMLPLESFEMGVPCITGNNHHYFKNSTLESYIVVNNEDDPNEIKTKILNCLENKEKVMELYDNFKNENLENAKKLVEKFLKK